MPEIEFFQCTDAGRVRSNNEDAVGCWPHEDGLLFAVADGMGGHNAGEFASTLTLEVLAREMDRVPGTWPVTKRLRKAIQEANLQIFNKAFTVPELSGMGTTLTATTLIGASIVTAHVGDCRLYLLRDDELRQLTKDHTYVAERVQFGLLSAAQARVHPQRNLLSRSLGKDLIVSIDLISLELKAGDVVAQCSDGVHGLIEDAELAEILRSNPPEPACQRVVERAHAAGARDNLSIQVARALSTSPTEPSASPRRWWGLRR
jgi:protein phosphatase